MNDRSIEMINNINFDSKKSFIKKRFRIEILNKSLNKRKINVNEFNDENDENDEFQNVIDEISKFVMIQIFDT